MEEELTCLTVWATEYNGGSMTSYHNSEDLALKRMTDAALMKPIKVTKYFSELEASVILCGGTVWD